MIRKKKKDKAWRYNLLAKIEEKVDKVISFQVLLTTKDDFCSGVILHLYLMYM